MDGWAQAGFLFSLHYPLEKLINLCCIQEGERPMIEILSRSDFSPGCFFRDLIRQSVQIWPFESDNPNTNGKNYIGKVWYGFSNVPAAYKIHESSDVSPYIPTINDQNVPPIMSQMPQLVSGTVSYNFGDIQLNTTFFHENFNRLIYVGSRVLFKMLIIDDGPVNSNWFLLNGRLYLNYFSDDLLNTNWQKNPDNGLFYLRDATSDFYFEEKNGRVYQRNQDEYSRFVVVSSGSLKSLVLNDAGATLSFADSRFTFRDRLPLESYTLAGWPYIQNEGKERPILLGEKHGIAPVLVDPQLYIYEISQTNFTWCGSVSLQSVDAVYKDGVLLSPSAYTVNLSTGILKLNDNPGESIVTIDAKGLKIETDFETGSLTGNYSANIADITLFLLQALGLSNEEIDLLSLKKVRDLIGFICGEYLDVWTETPEILSRLQTTGVFILVPGPDGNIAAKIFDENEESKAILREHDLTNLVINPNQDLTFSRLFLQYDRNEIAPDEKTTDGSTVSQRKSLETSANETSRIYEAPKSLELSSILIDRDSAGALMEKLRAIYFTEPIAIQCGIPPRFYKLTPGDKITLSYSPVINGSPVTIFDEKTFYITSTQFSPGKEITITAIPTSQTLRGFTIVDESLNPITDENENYLVT